jgi:hypothetical protein
VGGTRKTRLECFIEALHINPKLAGAWSSLGSHGGGTVDGKHKTPSECLNEALRINPKQADA